MQDGQPPGTTHHAPQDFPVAASGEGSQALGDQGMAELQESLMSTSVRLPPPASETTKGESELPAASGQPLIHSPAGGGVGDRGAR